MQTFSTWIEICRVDKPTATSISDFITDAGSEGVARREVLSRFKNKLEPSSIMNLLDAMVGVELIRHRVGNDLIYVSKLAR